MDCEAVPMTDPIECIWCSSPLESVGVRWSHFECGASWHPENEGEPDRECLKRVVAAERERIASMVEGAEVGVPFDLTTVPWEKCNDLIVAVQKDLARQIREGFPHD